MTKVRRLEKLIHQLVGSRAIFLKLRDWDGGKGKFIERKFHCHANFMLSQIFIQDFLLFRDIS